MTSKNQTNTPDAVVIEGVGRIIPHPVEDELSSSFMEYAMSVIVSRAIPDVRDGLKPVQRRILYSMWEQNLRSDRQHQKSAKVVGAVMGNYHPHGDAAIYDAMVRLSQDWVMRVPLVDGQGNFGSPDDSPASSRYTEARLSRSADYLVGDLGEGTVDYIPTYSGTGVQPSVLPAKFPNLIVNGGSGIAVGMATTIVPHNLAEVARGVKLLLDKPDASLPELMKVIPGPDFPTGGILIEGEGLAEAYKTGRGTIRVRGRVEIEEASQGRRNRRTTQIVVKELPYGVGPERFITRTVEAIQAKKVDGVTGISDHSDRHAGQRIVLDLKSGVNPAAVLAQLYTHTPLEERIAINQVVLVDGAPVTVGLKRILELWVEFAVEVVHRRTLHRLGKAEERLHLVAGLVKALDAIDEIVAAIKKSKTTQTAREKIMKLIDVDEEQANHILEMPLRRLSSLERTKLREEARELTRVVTELRKLAESRRLQEAEVLRELEEAVTEVGDPRRTTIITADTAEVGLETAAESVEIADEECVVTLSRTRLIGRDLGGRRRTGADDILIARIPARTRGDILLLGSDGVAVRRQGYELETAEGARRGERSTNLGVKQPVGVFSTTQLEAGLIPVIVTRGGVVKRVNPADLSQMSEVNLIRLAEGDEVVWAGCASETADVVFITAGGQVLRTPASKIRPQGRSAGGMAGINLTEDDEVIAAGTVDGDGLICVVTDAGRVKATPIAEYPTKGRATGGVRTIRFLKGETRLTGAGVITETNWTWVDGDGAPLGATEPAKRDTSGEPLDGAAGVGFIR